jgi:hypothetical protein
MTLIYPFVPISDHTVARRYVENEVFADHISVQSDSWLGDQGAKTKNTKSAVNPEVMAGLAPNFYHS